MKASGMPYNKFLFSFPCNLTDHSQYFSDYAAIWVYEDQDWFGSRQCMWEGPGFISHKPVLERCYGSSTILKRFFTGVLDIPNWKLEDVIEEIEQRRDDWQLSTQLSLTREIYEFLNANTHTDSDRELIK